MKRLLTSVLMMGLGMNVLAQTAPTATTTTTAPTTTTSVPATENPARTSQQEVSAEQGVSASTGPASATSTETFKQFHKTPFSLGLNTETYSGRREGSKDLVSANTYLYPTVHYQVYESSILALYPNIAIERDQTVGEVKYNTRLDYLALRFTQESILTEEVDGVEFKADARYYAYPTDSARKENQADGRFNVRTYLDRKFSDKFSLNNHNRLWFTNKGETTTDKTYERSLDVRLTPSYAVTDKFSTGVLFQYLNDFAKLKSSDQLLVIPNANYRFSDELDLTLEVQVAAAKSHDPHAVFGRSNFLTTPTLTYAPSKNFSMVLLAEAPMVDEKGDFIGDDFADNFAAELDFNFLAF